MTSKNQKAEKMQQPEEQTYQLVSLTIDNVMRLSAVHIDFNGQPVVVIGGENGAGKSSILKSIEMAMGGMDAACGEPVHHGAGWARVVLDLGDIIVTRKWIEGRERESVLEVKSKSGARFSSPQTMLSSLLGRLGFDPMDFEKRDSREPKKQERILRELAGIKTDDIEKAYDKSFEERTAVNRSVKTLQAQFDGYHHYPDAPAAEVSIADLTKELEAANETARALAVAREAHGLVKKDLVAADQAVMTSEKNVETLGTKLKELQRQVEETERSYLDEQNRLLVLKEASVEAARVVQKAVEKGIEVSKAVINTAPIKEKIEAAEGVNRKVRANETYNGLKQALDDEKANAQKLTDDLNALLAEKAARLAAAKFPIPGLAIDDRGVVFNNVPFDQASQAERIRVAVAISAAMNPKLRLILVREGGLLDSKSMKLLQELAIEYKMQVIVERVSESGEGCTVVIEDGAVKIPVVSNTVQFNPNEQAVNGLGKEFPDQSAGLLESHRMLDGPTVMQPAPKKFKQGQKKQEAA